jgi:BlaI family transcriptional regulator, penicillinase repressor
LRVRFPFPTPGFLLPASQPHPKMHGIFHPFRSTVRQLGPLEQRILDELWSRGSTTVRELLEASCQDLAYTTVMTTLDRLYKKGLLARSEDGRAFRYTTRFSREQLQREVTSQTFRQLLDAAPASSLPLSLLVEILSEKDGELLDDLSRLVEEKRRELRAGDTKRTTGRRENP